MAIEEKKKVSNLSKWYKAELLVKVNVSDSPTLDYSDVQGELLDLLNSGRGKYIMKGSLLNTEEMSQEDLMLLRE